MLDRPTPYLLLLFLCGKVLANTAVFNPCASQAALSETEAHKVMESWPDPPIDRAHKCYLTCVLLDLGLVDQNGDVQIDKYLKSGVVDWRYVAFELINCRIEFGDERDLCELSYGLFNCFRAVKLAAESNSSLSNAK
ncbi:general odorant-binding protein 57e [Drosophila erecta]|uniref:Odorant-binding protein 57e n=1 Tax=Drosophila erecta TaxID=7220 RepID=B0M2D1_DROER|nr:general odorant-binding protein 57e [Drosophila erecta]EDV55319.1 Odorant-binding protein 57e [Drosophila erecta]BAG11609.1 odorant-binding protein 57e [Drosophila erecta]